MRLTHLHLVSGNLPDRLVPINLPPLGFSKFAGADIEVRRELEGKQRLGLARIAVDRPQKLADVVRLGEPLPYAEALER